MDEGRKIATNSNRKKGKGENGEKAKKISIWRKRRRRRGGVGSSVCVSCRGAKSDLRSR